jgi:ferredoxin
MFNDYFSNVSIRTVDHSADQLCTILDKSLKDLGGIEKFVKGKSTVFLKIDLNQKIVSQQIDQLYGNLLYAISKKFLEYGVKIQIGDASILPIKNKFERKIKLKRIKELKSDNIQFVDLEMSGSLPVSINNRTYYISRPILEADIVINVPFITSKNKDRNSSLFNLAGVLPGYSQHVILNKKINDKQFASVSIDLLSAVKPELTILLYLDKKNLNNFLLSSTDSIALDSVLGLFNKRNKLSSMILVEASDAGLGVSALEILKIIGDIENLPIKLSNSKVSFNFIKKIKDYFSSRFTNYSEIWIRRENCNNCYKCTIVCPTGAIRNSTINLQKPIKDELCIDCYCCHANCPSNAIVVDNHFLNAQITQ